MTASRFQRLMHGIALAAALALVTVPTLGRVAQACRTVAPGEAWSAMCTAAGLAYVPATAPSGHHHHMASAGSMAPVAPAPHQHPHDGGGDCDYCPLLQSMVGSSALALLPTAHLSPMAPQVVLRTAAPAFRHPSGLGSRGPPALS